jgi:hypothetical protein
MRWLSRHLRPGNHAKRKNNYQYTEVDIIVVDSRTVAESSDPGDAAAGPERLVHCICDSYSR